MHKFCCQPQQVSGKSEETPGNRRFMNPLVLALALTTGQEHLTALYHPCCLCGGKKVLLHRGLNSAGRSIHPLPCVAEPVTSGPQPRADQPRADQPRARLLEALHRQLQVELKVKQGAENMIRTCASGTPKVSAGV